VHYLTVPAQYILYTSYQVVWPPDAADMVCPSPRAVTQHHRPIAGHGNTISNRLPSLKFIGDTLSVSELISLVTLTFDLLTSNLVRVIARGVGNLSTNLGVSGTFCSRRMGQHLTKGPRDLATSTVDLGGHDA